MSFPSDLMSFWLSFSLSQNKLNCYYVFPYPVYSTTRAKPQHMMCGALAPQKQDLNNKSLTQLRNAKVTFSFSYKTY